MRARSVVVYTVLRLLAFLVPFGILMLLPFFRQTWWLIALAAVFAALIGLSLSILFLSKPRDAVSEGFATRKENRAQAAPKHTAAQDDADIEDAANAAARGETED
ncbi:hypothetical protein LK09_09105 [Microbacterium mangrovi]|uniref:Mechanosensitive ion channel protein MscS n=1 Tax=Microbacterium mangrovi TaxID=1348253 RepID=A0A0B2A899_9MICO|nr:DUF4229 domain-containing protein [Microbacterium mangrovi]KHK97988.1 hypothetical protein LK09_09105 [Microbacterium mangrovi]